MSDVDRYFHEVWLGMVQPVDGLVVSIPVLVDAQCMERQAPHVQQKLIELCPSTKQGEAGPEGFRIADLARFFFGLLGLTPDLFDGADALPDALSLYVPEGRQTLRPTLALKKQGEIRSPKGADATPASSAGASYELLVWQLPDGLDPDKPEAVTGTWDYPPSAKLDRLLRYCRVPIGLLINGDSVRLIYAPHGESSGAITFRFDDMASVGGRPILDALVMLLSANRFFGVAEERTLPALLSESRKRQANVTNDLAAQVFEALQILLRGFQSAAERDGRDLLDDALAREGDHLYKGLLTVLLRLVFVLYAEDRGLLPSDPLYAENFSVLGLFEQLQGDLGSYPDSMSRRFGAWGRLVTLFRAIFLGLSHGDLKMPPRQGSLFNPHEYPFLEGWGPAGSAPITQPEDRAAVKLPTLDDETVFRVLERLLVLEGQRLSYRSLDVEQIGSVYEALMGYHVLRVPSEAVCMKPDRVWVSVEDVFELPNTRRAKWLKESIGLSAAQSEKLNEELNAAQEKRAIGQALEALTKFAACGKKGDPSLSKARPGQLVLQPGSERRRTSSHYTPRSLSVPIVQRALEPLLAVMGDSPPSDLILNLKVCDPAMGSGAFLVEACRFLADHVVAAWTREQKLGAISVAHGDPLLHARRLVAQRCLYGVDKNDAAVELAKLSLWLVTLSNALPFTFLDHSLRHGDSLVGLDFDQIRSFHWKHRENESSKQLELFGREIAVALEEAIALRQKIGDLGDSPLDDREKARLFWDAQDALDRVRLIGDLIVGAFFAGEKDKEREMERLRRENLVRDWLLSGGQPTDELLAMQHEIRARFPVFHWMAEFPEIFYAERADPLEEGRVNRAAFMDAFVGNPPFLGRKLIGSTLGPSSDAWLASSVPGAAGQCDLAVFFLRSCVSKLGAHGTVGFVATNTLAQGDSREAGLAWLLHRGAVIYDAMTGMAWPGEAAVTVATVHLAIGKPSLKVRRILDHQLTSFINSHLEPRAERSILIPLFSNRHGCGKGAELGAVGFVVTASERESLLAGSTDLSANLPLLVGGDELNTSPDHGSTRYAIDLDGSDAANERLAGLRCALRERLNDGEPSKDWWHFRRPGFRSTLGGLSRFLGAAIYTKHLAFAFLRPGVLANSKVMLFASEAYSTFCVLQSRFHVLWSGLTCGTTGGADTLAYSASDCFETFPFPESDPRTVILPLEDIGERLYVCRAKYMVDENVGLTTMYNRLYDAACSDVRVLELRGLHEEMDQKVLEAYAEGDPGGLWLDVSVPRFCPVNDDDKKKLEHFEDDIVKRLFALNATRAEEERIKGLGAVTKANVGKTTKSSPAKKGAAAARRHTPPAGQQLALAGTKLTDVD